MATPKSKLLTPLSLSSAGPTLVLQSTEQIIHISDNPCLARPALRLHILTLQLQPPKTQLNRTALMPQLCVILMEYTTSHMKESWTTFTK